MRLLVALPVVTVCLLFLVAPAGAELISESDLWDVSQGGIVDDSSGCLSGWPCGNVFAPGQAIFDDYLPAGTVHWIEWHTPAAVTIESINLVAMHDGPPTRDIRYRGISAFRLYHSDTLGGPWTLLHELADTDPDANLRYDGGPNYPGENYLEYCVAVPSTTAQYWRAEFVQYGYVSGNSSGPRVWELDGYDFVIPEPGTICLLGLAFLLLGRRRK
jgi:hypothetical protein